MLPDGLVSHWEHLGEAKTGTTWPEGVQQPGECWQPPLKER